MGRRDELIALYADDLRHKCGIEPDMVLLGKVTAGCGPLIYDAETAVIAADQPQERETIKRAYLMRKLGLENGPHLGEAIEAAIDIYGRAEPRKYRAVVYYILCRHFGRESVYG